MSQNIHIGRPRPIVLRDGREKLPWTFEFYDVDILEYPLKSGDYSLKGFANRFAIERKRNTGELAINLGTKGKQFEAELERLSQYTYKYVICEFPLGDLDVFPERSGIPQSRWKYLRIHKNFLKSRISQWSAKYDIEFIFCNDAFEAESVAYTIITSCWNRLNDEDNS